MMTDGTSALDVAPPESTADRVLRALDGYGLKQEGRNQYRSNSPFREGSNSHAFALTIDDGEHGAYFDHVSSEAGTLYELAERLGIAVERTTKRPYRGLADYAEAHHVTADVLEKAGWREVTREGRPALEFPTQTGKRFRFLDGGDPSYKSVGGYKRCWYGLGKAVARARMADQPLVIANGEVSVIVAQRAGVAACAPTGGEKSSLPPDLLQELAEAYDGPVLIALDSDDTGRNAARGLVRQLRAAGFDARAVDLGGGVVGYDLADFCGRWGSESSARLKQLAYLEDDTPQLEDTWGHEEPKPEPLRIYSIADIWALQSGIQKAWGGWMLQNNVTLIGGVPNVGKSPLLMWLVKCFLEGRWPDGEMVPDEMRGRKVVYCLPEGFAEQTELFLQWGLDPAMLAERVKIPAITMGEGEAPNYQFKLDFQQGGMATLHQYCEAVQPGMVVIDGLRAAMVGDESSSTDVNRFYDPLIQLATRFKCAVPITHHLTKGSESASREGALPSLDWFRGSGELGARPRSAWIVDQPNQDDPELRRITLVKAAAGPKMQMMAFRMSDPALGLQWLEAMPAPPPKNKREVAERFILQALRGGKMTHDELWQACEAEELGVSPATFRDARVALSNRGAITQVVEGKRYSWALPAHPSDEDDEDDLF